jgi:hypothetical protein
VAIALFALQASCDGRSWSDNVYEIVQKPICLTGGKFVAGLKLQEWSAIAEILSSVAVLATLVFFVVEIGQTNDAVRANTYQGMAAMTVEFNAQFFENPEVSEFIARTASVEYELTASESIRLRSMISATYRMMNNTWFQYEVGTITEEQMESLLYPAVLNFRRRGRMRLEWEEGEDRLMLDSGLVEYLDGEIYETRSD